MIIKQYTLDPILTLLIESNNQQEKKLEIQGAIIEGLKREITDLRNENIRRRSAEFW